MIGAAEDVGAKLGRYFWKHFYIDLYDILPSNHNHIALGMKSFKSGVSYVQIPNCQFLHYVVFSEKLTKSDSCLQLHSLEFALKYPPHENLPLGDEMFPFKYGVIKVNVRSGLVLEDEYITLFRRE